MMQISQLLNLGLLDYGKKIIITIIFYVVNVETMIIQTIIFET